MPARNSQETPFLKYFDNSDKFVWVNPGNEFMLDILAGTATFDCDQAANTHTTENFMVPFPCEITGIYFLANAAQAFTTLSIDFGLVLPANNITTVANAIAAHRFATGGAAGDVTRGVYQSALTGSNVVAANTLYEGAVIVRPTGGIVTAVQKAIQIWMRPIRSTE